MKYTKYSKYVPDPAGEMSMEDLLSALSDYLLQAGFQNDSMYFEQLDEHSLDDLRQAIEQALEMGEFLDEEMRERLEQMQADGTLDELIEQLIERMEQEDYFRRPAARSFAAVEHGGTNRRGAAKRGLKSPTRAWTFSASRPCAI